MNERLFLIKFKNNFGIGVYGVCKVISHKGLVLTETEPNEFNIGAYRFKVRGASKQIVDRNGSLKWLRQKLFCYVSKDSVLAKIAKDLAYGDVIEIFGVLKSSEYITDNGEKRKKSVCNLCKLTVISKVDKDPAVECKEIDDYDFSDFTDF